MRWATAISDARDVGRALEETCEVLTASLGGQSPHLLLIFVSPHHGEDTMEISEHLQDAFPDAILVGCSGGGIIACLKSKCAGDYSKCQSNSGCAGILVYLVFVATVVWAIARTRMRPVRGLVVLWRRLSPVVVACWALWWATQRLLPAIS